MGKDLVTFGYAAIDIIDTVQRRGGSAANVAMNAEKLGYGAGLVSVFGTDEISQTYWNHLAQLGVDLTFSLQIPGISLPTSTMSHTDRTSGWQDNGAADAMSQLHPREAALRDVPVLHFASANPMLIKNTLPVIPVDALVSYSPGPKIVASPELYLNKALLAKTTVLFLSEQEWMAVRDHLQLTTPQELLGFGPSAVIITQGEKGALVVGKENDTTVQCTIPATAVENPETTGAGDAFALGFLIGYTKGFDLATSGEIGGMLATCALQTIGGEIDKENIAGFQGEMARRGMQIL